jgi:hypothetical protein
MILQWKVALARQPFLDALNNPVAVHSYQFAGV